MARRIANFEVCHVEQSKYYVDITQQFKELLGIREISYIFNKNQPNYLLLLSFYNFHP